MKRSMQRWANSSLYAAAAFVLLFILACGPGEEPTPTATKAAATPTATKAAATATPTKAPVVTPTQPGPVATPTATSVATPTPTPTPGEQPQRGGSVLIVGGYPESFDPKLLTASLGNYPWNAPFYNNLLANYEGDKIECELCTGWRVENSGKTWVFDLVKGAKYHDGREVTAEDVKYSLELQMGYIDGIVSPRGGVIKEFIDKVDAPSKYEVRINLFRPTTFQNKVLGIGASVIYPKGTARTDLQSKTQGSGPFLLTKAISGAGVTMDRNPNYFKPGLPYLDRIEAKVVTAGPTTDALFLTGKTKYFQGNRESDFQQLGPTLAKMYEEGKLSRKRVLGGLGIQGIWMNKNKPPFNDLRVRKAFNLIADRTALDKVMNGPYGHPALMGYTPGMPFALPPEKIWDVVPGWGTGAKKQQEIEEAKKLLADAGYANGMNVDFLVVTPIPTANYGPASEPYQQALKQLGVNAKFLLVSRPEMEERHAKSDFLFQIYILGQSTFDPDELIGQNFLTGGPRNITAYSHPEVDKLYQQMITTGDFANKKEIFFKIQDILVLQDVAFAPLTSANGITYWWKDLRGFTIGMTAWSGAGQYRFDRVWLKVS